MEKLTNDQFSMFSLWTSEGSPNATSSRESEGGHTPCASPDGLTKNQSGPDRHHANHSVLPGQTKAETTSDISPPILSAWSGLAAPQCCLANKSQARLCSERLQSALEARLRERLNGRGSMIYQTVWKQHVTPLGRAIFRLRASARRTSDSEPFSELMTLPTPSGTSNHGRNHVAGRLDEWGGSSNPFRGTPLGKVHCPSFELWMMGYPGAWSELMPRGTQSVRTRQRRSSKNSTEQ